jgi:hypothetical protein
MRNISFKQIIILILLFFFFFGDLVHLKKKCLAVFKYLNTYIFSQKQEKKDLNP